MSTQYLVDLLSQFGVFAVFGSILISTIISILGVIPSIFVTSANVIIFGVLYGFLISWIGEITGAAVSFYLYRLGFKKTSGKYAKNNNLIYKISTSSGSKAGWLVFQVRLLPFIPSGIVTLLASISGITIWTFLIATAFGKMPSILLEVLISYDIVNIYQNWIRLIITIIGILALYFVLRYYNKEKKPDK